jgi:hypothetical protein
LKDLYTIIIGQYPELTINESNDPFGKNGVIELKDDGDEIQYISKWDFEQPIPKGLKLGK